MIRILGKSIDDVINGNFFSEEEGKIRYMIIPGMIFSSPPDEVSVYVKPITKSNDWYHMFFKDTTLMSIVSVNDIGMLKAFDENKPLILHRSQFSGLNVDTIDPDCESKQVISKDDFPQVYNHPFSFDATMYPEIRIAAMNQFFPVEYMHIIASIGTIPDHIKHSKPLYPSTIPNPRSFSSIPPRP